jgi:hypothetical protein
MENLLDKLIDFFDSEEWEYQVLENRSILRISFSGENGHWPCFAQAREPQQQIIVYSICPLRVPEAKRAQMAEFLTRANYGLVIGNFEMDFEDGEVRYKTSLDLEDVEDAAEVTQVLLRHVIYANVSSMDRYLPGMLTVLAGSATPAEAVAQIDEAKEPDLSKS